MPSLRANLLARHAAHDAELTRRRHLVLADLAAPTPAVAPRPFLLTLWRELFIAARPAWAGLACVWLLLLAFTAANDRATPPAATPTLATNAVPLVTWSERERAIAALLASPPPPVVLVPPSGIPTSFLAPRHTAVSAV
jgi:hypothetical protein